MYLDNWIYSVSGWWNSWCSCIALLRLGLALDNSWNINHHEQSSGYAIFRREDNLAIRSTCFLTSCRRLHIHSVFVRGRQSSSQQSYSTTPTQTTSIYYIFFSDTLDIDSVLDLVQSARKKHEKIWEERPQMDTWSTQSYDQCIGLYIFNRHFRRTTGTQINLAH